MLIKNFTYRILAIIGAVCFGLSLFGLSMSFYNTDNLKVIQILQAVLVFILPAVFCAVFFSEKPFSFLSLQKTSAKNYLFAAMFAFSALPAINFFAWLNAQMRLPKFLNSLELWMRTMEEELMKVTEQMLAVDTLGGLAINLVVIALLTALCEELFFRGLLQKTLSERMNIHAAIWVTAFIFSAIHVQFYGFLPRMLLGAAFGYMAVWSGSLWLPILAHFINNAVGVIAFYIVRKQNITFDIENVGAENSWYLGLIFVPICIYFLLKISIKYQVSSSE